MNRYLFLDIDGVLNSERTVFAYNRLVHAGHVKYNLVNRDAPAAMFDPIAVKLLQVAQKQIGFKIVISSTWRHSLSLDDFHRLFDDYDWDTREIVIGKTGDKQGIRGDQIREWLEINVPKPHSYAILDDSSDMLPEQMNRLVLTRFENGLSYEDFVKLHEVFNVGLSTEIGYTINRKI